MVCVPTVNDASGETKVWDALISQKRSIKAEVLFPFKKHLREPSE